MPSPFKFASSLFKAIPLHILVVVEGSIFHNGTLTFITSWTSTATSCTNPLTFNPLPNSFSSTEYMMYRDQCTDKCNADGYCCTKGFGGCNHVPCNEGCHIAFFAEDLAACKAECVVANDAPNCEYDHSEHYQVGNLGYYPWWPDVGAGKCWDPLTCGCPQDNFGKDCGADACERGCELAYETDIRDNFYNGGDAIIDPNMDLSTSDLRSSIELIQSHMDGSSTMSFTQLKSVLETFETNSEMLKFDFNSMDGAFGLIDTYESKYGGGMFINSRTTTSGFPRDDSNDGYTLDRIILVVQQAIIDEIYHGTRNVKDKQKRIHDSIVENCQDYLRGRYWMTSAYFPGFVVLPSVQSTTIYSIDIKATVNKYWGRKECFSDSSAIHATGLYLPPGGVAWVTVPPALVENGFEIQVGANDVDTIIKDNQLRMNRVTCTYDVKYTKTYVASTLGGGIYIKVPYLANYGTQTISVSGDVIQAPFFSMTNLKTTSKTEWNILKNSPAPWADFETEYYMQVVPSSWISGHSYDHFKALLEGRDAAMKAFDYIGGYPDGKKNKQVLYLQPDLHIRADAFGVGYPQVNTLVNSGPDGITADTDHFLVTEPYLGLEGEVEYHEAGHCMLTATFTAYEGEIEAIVNFPYAHVNHAVGGQDFDYAFTYTMGRATGILTPDYASVDWMITENFRNGNEMSKDYESQEFQYQPRGYAKYADIYELFGADTLHNFFYQEHLDVEAGMDDYGLPDGYDRDDWRTLRLSIQAGVDLTPLMHYWGVHPEDGDKLKASMEANNLPLSMDIHNLIKHRLDMVPKNYAEFLDVFSIVWPGWNDNDVSEYWGCKSYCCSECGQYYFLMNKWDETQANKAVAAGEAILSMYYGEVTSTPTPPTTTTPTPPTSNPTIVAEPTPVAEPTSTDDCTESNWTKWLFKIKSDGSVKTKNCSWLASKKVKKIANICKNKTESNAQYDTPKQACPITCKVCGDSCDEDEDAKFVFKLKKKNGAKYRTCGWLSGRKNAANICKRTDSYGGIGPPAEVCPITCDIC